MWAATCPYSRLPFLVLVLQFRPDPTGDLHTAALTKKLRQLLLSRWFSFSLSFVFDFSIAKVSLSGQKGVGQIDTIMGQIGSVMVIWNIFTDICGIKRNIMDNIISGEMSAELMEGVSDVLSGIRHGFDASSENENRNALSGSSDMVAEDGIIILCRCGDAVVFPVTLYLSARNHLILLRICWCSVPTFCARPVWISSTASTTSCVKTGAEVIPRWFPIL